MAYASAADLTLAWGADEVARSGDRDGDGDADTGVIDRALDDASAEIDGYIGRVYDLPLVEPYPVLLRRLACDVAIYRMSGTIAPLTDEKRRRYDDALRTLERIAEGDMDIGLGVGGEAQAVTSPVEHGADEREWTRDTTAAGGLW